VHIYFGNAGVAFDATPDHVIEAVDCSPVGDVNGDGFDDLAVVTSAGNGIVYGGQGATTTTPFSKVGRVKAAGDVNGDGYGDLLVIAWEEVQVFYGGSGTLDGVADGILRGAVSGDMFGSAAVAGGDVNGDGFADVLVGAPWDATNGLRAGRAYLYLGGSGPAFEPTPDGVFSGTVNMQLGFNVASIGDINGDGFGDLAAAFSFLDTSNLDVLLRGGLRVYLGNAGTSIDTVSDTELAGVGGGAYFGEGIAAGDVNGDAFDDLMVGSPGFEATDYVGDNIGQAYVYLGAAGRQLDPIPDTTFNGAGARDYFGCLASGVVFTPGVFAR
jgi:FG-GAP repeat